MSKRHTRLTTGIRALLFHYRCLCVSLTRLESDYPPATAVRRPDTTAPKKTPMSKNGSFATVHSQNPLFLLQKKMMQAGQALMRLIVI